MIAGIACIYFVNNSVILYALSIIVCTLYQKHGTLRFPINTQLFSKCVSFIILSVVIQIIIQGQPLLLGFERNFSALFLFYLSLLGNRWQRATCLVLGLLTLSRGFLLASIIHYIFSSNLLIFRRFTGIKYWRFALFLIPSLFALLFLFYPYINPTPYTASAERLFNFADASALSRFDLIKPAISNFSKYWLFGFPSEWYVGNFFGGTHMVHNNYFQLFILYGVPFTLAYLFALGYLFSGTRNNRAIFISLFAWGFTLHSVFNPQYLCIIYILSLQYGSLLHSRISDIQ